MREKDRAWKFVTRAANKLKDVKRFEASYPVQAGLANDLKARSAIKATKTVPRTLLIAKLIRRLCSTQHCL